MIRLKTAILLGTLLFFGSEELQAAAIPGVPAAATPAVHPEPLVQGGLLGAISSSIDDIQSRPNTPAHTAVSSRKSPATLQLERADGRLTS